MIYCEEKFHYLQDHIGSPVRLLGTEQTDTALAYDEFGVPMVGAGQNRNNPFGFTGYQMDDVSGLYFAQARYYEPQLGRFGAEDTHWGTENRIWGDNLENRFIPSISAIVQSSNLYSYTMNNPLCWIDPRGYEIKLSGDATDEQKEEYERAISYLKTSATANELINLLTDSTESFTIVFTTTDKNLYDPAEKEIFWNPTKGMLLDYGKSVVSPAVILAHEMGHGAQHLNGDMIPFFEKRITIEQLEADNLKKYENPIGDELGEFTRKNYGDAYGMYKVNNSTDWGTVTTLYLWYEGILPWNWGKPSKTFENLNTWEPSSCNN